MKRSLFFLMSLLTLPASLIAQDRLQTDTTGSSAGYIILFLLVLLVLLALALRLFKNTNQLKALEEQPEESGRSWLKKRLPDLNQHQLDTLIKRKVSPGGLTKDKTSGNLKKTILL